MNGTIGDGGFAFPRKLPDVRVPPDEALDLILRYSGMTLRDYFAAKALVGVLGFIEEQKYWGEECGVERARELTAEKSYEFADAMLKARQS